MDTHVYHIDENGNRFQWKATRQGFKEMRGGALMRLHDSTHKCFTYRFVDELDRLSDMKVGQTLFFTSYPYGAFSEQTLEAFNHTCARMQVWSEMVDNKNVNPDWLNSFCIKRTEKLFVYHKLEC